MRSSCLILLVACGGVAEPPAPPVDARPDVVIVTLDTTRADATGPYGQSPSPTPRLDALAASGLVVDEAMTTCPLTLPAHASLFTGRTPDHHGVRDNHGHYLPDSETTLAEVLRGRGYATGAFVAAMVLDGVFGLAQGFDTYADGFDLSDPGSPGDPVVQWPGAEVRARAEAWVGAQRADAPLMVWLHLYDAHLPLTPEEPFASAWEDAYLAEVAYADAQLGALLDAVAKRGRERVVVVSGDHGEGRGDHGEARHGLFVYRSTMHVPLVVAGDGVGAGHVDGARSIVDVMPTVLDLLELPVPDWVDGQSLLVPVGPDRAVYGESFHGRLQYGFAELRVLQDATWRYVLAPREELYAWGSDPAEAENRALSEPDVARRFREALIARGAGASATGDLDPETAAALAALGYVGGGTAVDAAASFADLPDPKGAPDMVERFEKVVLDARTRPPADAVPLLEAFVATHPAVGSARHLLARALELSGRPREARDATAPLVEALPNDPMLLARMGELSMLAGEDDVARDWLRRAIAARPSYPVPYAVLGELERRRGDCAAAVREVERGLAASPDAATLLLVRGTCRYSTGDLAGARRDLEAVVDADPRDPDAWSLLGLVLVGLGDADGAVDRFRRQVAVTPDSVRAHSLLGTALYATGRYADAVAPLRIAADRGGEAEPALLAADALLRSEGDVDAAGHYLDAAAKRDPADLRVHAVRSAWHMKRGEVSEALAAMAAARGHGLDDIGLPR